ncbi:MAG: dihydroorotate dehydrogenase electron transfer subunit [Gemmatimonadota bacterium]|nr:MAG: dihydroorotate dehydrogenase electron transfer subunit [Gemmatimonadota bacterium]
MTHQPRSDSQVNEERRIVRKWCPVSAAEEVAEATFWLEFVAPEIAARAAPGQFVMIGFGTGGWGTPFLPRPNSVAAVTGDRIGLLIRVYGGGSRRLAGLRRGDEALILGPLGNHFQIGTAERVLCLAGGVGLAPFLLLPGWLERETPGTVVRLLYGERRGAAVFNPDKIRAISGIAAEVWTEDGSLGRQGLVTEGASLEDMDLVLACGPTPMLKAVRKLALDAGIRCQVAVEEHMACGLGTCIGCAIGTTDPETGAEGYDLVCRDGPVFAAERLRW